MCESPEKRLKELVWAKLFGSKMLGIGGIDKLKSGDKVSVRQKDGTWKEIEVGVEYSGVYHPEPAGTPFTEVD